MKEFKGKFVRHEQGNNFTKYSEKSFRKTGKNLLQFELDTIFVPNHKTPRGWFW